MISEKIMRHPVLTIMGFILVVIMGLFKMDSIALALYPEIENPVLSVFASYENAGPESVEKAITKPLENALVSLSNLKNMTSSSSEGRSYIRLEFTYGTDLETMVNDMRDKIDRVKRSLPDGVTPTIYKFNSNSRPIMRIALRGNRDANELKQIAENKVTDVLEQAEGVGEASVNGGRSKIVRVELEQNRLQAYGLTLSSVASSLSKQNIELGGGTITEGGMDYSIRTTGEYNSIEEINETVVTTKNGYNVKLSDIGKAFMGYKDASSVVYINGVPGVYVSITKQSGANSVAVADNVYRKIKELEQILPSDISLEVLEDDSIEIRDTLNILIESAKQGLVLAVIVLFIFLCSFKTTIIIAISIPVSILITLLSMNLFGITLNMMTMTGLILGVGMIVDASVVMIDNIYSYRCRGTKPGIAAVLGSGEMIASVISGNLTTICVFIPFLLFMADLEYMGQMFKGIIFTVVIALASSLLVAIFLVPVLAGRVFPLTDRRENPVQNPVLKFIYGSFEKSQNAVKKIYARILKGALENRAVTIIVCASFLVISLMLSTTIRMQLMSGGHDASVTLTMTLPAGTSLEETTAVVLQFQEIVENEIKGYDTLTTSIGGGRRNSSTYSGSIQIQLPEAKEQIDDDSTIKQKLRRHFDEFPGVEFNFSQGRRQQMTGNDIDITVKSTSLENAMKVAQQISDVMNSIPDIGEASVDTENGLPQVQIEIDRQRAYSFGVSVSAAANEINCSIEGKQATTFRQNGDEYSVFVLLRPEDRQAVIDLEQIYVTGNNGLVSVANFAKVVKGLGPVSIERKNRQRIVHVTADIISEKGAQEVEAMIKQGISDTFIIPDGVFVGYEGSWQDIQKQKNVFGKIIALAIILVFGVMAATYESLRAPFINLMTIPFLLIGVILIHKISGQPFSMLSAVGLVMLVGIVVNNGIILVDYTNLLRERGMEIRAACYEAGCSRLRPVLMTTLTTILGMIPMALSSEGSAGIVQPIAVVIIGGLFSSTFITLFFIPVLYSFIMNTKSRKRRRIYVELPEEKCTE